MKFGSPRTGMRAGSRSLIWGGVRSAITRLPVGQSHSDGYLRIHLGRKAPRYVLAHRLIAHTFLPKTRESPLIRHLNDIGTDNRVSNLAGGDDALNQQDAIRNGRRPGLTRAVQLTLVADAGTMGVPALADKYGITSRYVHRILYRHMGRRTPTIEEITLLAKAIVGDSQRMTDRAVADKYGVCTRTVINYRIKDGYRKPRGRRRRLISLTNATNMC